MYKKLLYYKIGIVFLGLITAFLISFNASMGILFGSFFVIAIPLLYLFYNYPVFGVTFTIVISYFILGILRFVNLPLGILMDALVLLLYLFMVYKITMDKNEKIQIKSSLSIVIVIWIVYNILEVFNPAAASREVWIYAIRPVAITMLMYFISLKYMTGYSNIRIYAICILVLSSLLAAYGVFQEFNGLLPFEEAWVRSDEGRFALFFNWWRFRKFSFFADPMTFGVTCAYSGVFAMILSFGVGVKLWKRLLLIFATGLMLFSMVFSGTRTAYVMPVAGFAFYVVLNLNWKVITLASIVFAMGVGVILSPIKSLGPIDENNLSRIRSAFLPTDDPSFNVRLVNQAMIQPYIHSHPIGGGIGSTGLLAVKFTPFTLLSKFQVDSGFVKIAVEQGTIGLIIYMILLFLLFKMGINAYFACNDVQTKNIISAILCTFFSIIVANYAQEVITMYPTNILFYTGMGILASYHKKIV